MKNTKTFLLLSFLLSGSVFLIGCAKLEINAAKSDSEFTKNSAADDKSVVSSSPEQATANEVNKVTQPETTGDLLAPVRLESDGSPIDTGALAGTHGHAGPWIADVDTDGDNDLLVGDFPGYFWFFENVADDSKPKYVSKGKLMAGDEAAKTPVY